MPVIRLTYDQFIHKDGLVSRLIAAYATEYTSNKQSLCEWIANESRKIPLASILRCLLSFSPSLFSKWCLMPSAIGMASRMFCLGYFYKEVNTLSLPAVWGSKILARIRAGMYPRIVMPSGNIAYFIDGASSVLNFA